jgi:glutaminyl-tRNA synthetase
MIDPPKKFFRLGPGREVRLRYSYFVTCVDYKTDAEGKVTEIHCTYDPATYGGNAPDGRKVQGTIHWVSATEAVEAEVRLYEPLFLGENPEDVPEGVDYKTNLNPDSLKVITAYVEPGLSDAKALTNYQFERIGYFNVDPDSTPGKPVFNRTVTLKDSWSKMEKA